MKDALKNDRARIQVGRISHFGLLEMSRQRIRTGVLEGSSVVCSHCAGAGVVRSTSSVALHVLRVLEDALIKSAANDMTVRARTPVALYILNQKRAHLRDIERRFGVVILVEADDTLTGANYHALERGDPASGAKADEPAEARPAGYGAPPADGEEFLIEDEVAANDEAEAPEGEAAEDEFEGAEAAHGEGEATAGEGDGPRRRRRRRRRRGERPAGEGLAAEAQQPSDAGLASDGESSGGERTQSARGEGEPGEDDARAPSSRRRRGRRCRRGGGERTGAPSTMAEGAGPEDSGESAALGAAEPSHSHEDHAPQRAARSEPTSAADSEAESIPTSWRSDEHEAPPSKSGTAQSASPDAAPPSNDPTRPRRGGWWQRAKATVTGE